MNQHSSHLLLLALTAISAFTICPCKAQTPRESNSDQSNISSVSSEVLSTTDTTKSSQVGNSASDTTSTPTILSEATNNTSSDSVTLAKSNLRIPISSRIFAVPSMRQ